VRVKLELVLNQDEWSLGVTDQGGGDPVEVQKIIDGNEFPDLEDDRGRGIYLTRQMVDQMIVTRSPEGKGLTFRATKKHGG
jgi:anti-sigma regulatory factor (Ser/Thr protein kinase)